MAWDQYNLRLYSEGDRGSHPAQRRFRMPALASVRPITRAKGPRMTTAATSASAPGNGPVSTGPFAETVTVDLSGNVAAAPGAEAAIAGEPATEAALQDQSA